MGQAFPNSMVNKNLVCCLKRSQGLCWNGLSKVWIFVITMKTFKLCYILFWSTQTGCSILYCSFPPKIANSLSILFDIFTQSLTREFFFSKNSWRCYQSLNKFVQIFCDSITCWDKNWIVVLQLTFAFIIFLIFYYISRFFNKFSLRLSFSASFVLLYLLFYVYVHFLSTFPHHHYYNLFHFVVKFCFGFCFSFLPFLFSFIPSCFVFHLYIFLSTSCFIYFLP